MMKINLFIISYLMLSLLAVNGRLCSYQINGRLCSYQIKDRLCSHQIKSAQRAIGIATKGLFIYIIIY